MTKKEYKQFKKQINESFNGLISEKLKKLKKLEFLFELPILLLLFAGFVIQFFISWFSYILLAILVIYIIFNATFCALIDKELKKITKESFIYFKLCDFFTKNGFELATYLVIFFSAFLIFLFSPDFNKEIINTINIAFCSIVLSLYTFVLPMAHKYLKEQEEKIKHHNQNVNFFTLQGEIYSNKCYVNSLFSKIITMIIIFIFSEIIYFLQIFLFTLIAYFCFFYTITTLVKLSLVIKTIYRFNIKELEIDMYNDCIDHGLLSGKRFKKNKNLKSNKINKTRQK